LDFGEYQKLARKTAFYPERYAVVYPALGLCGEAGEVAEKIKKHIRDGIDIDNTLNKLKEVLSRELGDVLWYISNLASDLDISLNYIAKSNIDKLKDRKVRDKLKGSGDYR